MPSSSDGFVTVTADTPWASVKVVIDWAASSPLPWQTTVVRTNPDLTTATVRSGDLMFTPGGDGYAYDHESPVDGVCKYQAFGYSYTGALVQTSTFATITLTTTTSLCWVKCVNNPSLSFLLWGSLRWSRAGRVSVFDVPGASLPVVWTDVPSGRKGTLALAALSAADTNKVRAALAADSALLIQFAAADNVPSMYAAAELLDESPVGPRRSNATNFKVGVTEMSAPSTAGVPLRVPNWTNDIVAVTYATYTAWDAAFPTTYVNQAKGP